MTSYHEKALVVPSRRQNENVKCRRRLVAATFVRSAIMLAYQNELEVERRRSETVKAAGGTVIGVSQSNGSYSDDVFQRPSNGAVCRAIITEPSIIDRTENAKKCRTLLIDLIGELSQAFFSSR